MNDIRDKLIASQELEIQNLKQQVTLKDEALSTISNLLTCIGGPLNDNKLGYSKEQLVTFNKIFTVILNHDDAQTDEVKAEYTANTRVLEEMRNAMAIDRTSDFSVQIRFISARSCSAFIKELETARKLPTYEALMNQVRILAKKVTHWRANHAEVARRLTLATDRTDLPLHRTVAYREVTKHLDDLKAELASAYGETLARVHFHPHPDDPLDYDIHDATNFKYGLPECVEAVIVRRDWRCKVCNGAGVITVADNAGLHAESVCVDCDAGFIRNPYASNVEHIKPDQDQLIALALRGNLAPDQTLEVLKASGVISPPYLGESTFPSNSDNAERVHIEAISLFSHLEPNEAAEILNAVGVVTIPMSTGVLFPKK